MTLSGGSVAMRQIQSIEVLRVLGACFGKAAQYSYTKPIISIKLIACIRSPMFGHQGRCGMTIDAAVSQQPTIAIGAAMRMRCARTIVAPTRTSNATSRSVAVDQTSL